jgi:hypothetical protein
MEQIFTVTNITNKRLDIINLQLTKESHMSRLDSHTAKMWNQSNRTD